MKGMIFAAGLGTRLRPITDSTPKALIEVGGVTMLERVIERMKAVGINDITVNIHHHAEQIRRFAAHRADFGVTLHLSDESDELLDTGGGLAKAAPYLAGGEDVLVCNADIFTDFPIAEMAAAHAESGADVTLLCQERATSRKLLFSPDGRMTGWINSSTGEVKSPYSQAVVTESQPFAFGGIHILSPSAVNALAARAGKFSITPFYIEMCKELNIRKFVPKDDFIWVDIGKPETLAKAREIAEGK